jgi:hypothetical protein
LGELAQQDDILPLAFHVDYWDYIGWKDTYARAAHTQRQKDYANGFGTRSIYTPQMVVGGLDDVVGSKANAVKYLLKLHQEKQRHVTLTRVVLDTGESHVRVENTGLHEQPEKVIVQAVYFLPKAQIDIKRGENKGLLLHSTNVVTDVQDLGIWDGQDPAEFNLPTPIAPDGHKVAILVQTQKKGGYPSEILAAIALD